MTHRERALKTIKGGIPDFVPTFELLFAETERDFNGRVFYDQKDLTYLDEIQICKNNAQLYVDVARRYEHSIVFVSPLKWPYVENYHPVREMIKIIRDISGDEFCIMAPGDPTFKIPSDPTNFAMQVYDAPDKLKEEARKRVDILNPVYDLMIKSGADGFILTSDYALNTGTFLNPEHFSQFVTPYLALAVKDIHSIGGVVIKHTDGNLMRVMDQLVETGIDALHSIDPMAGMDIKEIKEKYGKKICLCGNVHCAWMQTGTPEQIRSSAEYCLQYGKPGGGYIFSTSNCVFRGMPLASYDIIHSIWKEKRNY